MPMETRNHAGRTPSEQEAWERRCANWQRQDEERYAADERRREADSAAKAWGEYW